MQRVHLRTLAPYPYYRSIRTVLLYMVYIGSTVQYPPYVTSPPYVLYFHLYHTVYSTYDECMVMAISHTRTHKRSPIICFFKFVALFSASLMLRLPVKNGSRTTSALAYFHTKIERNPFIHLISLLQPWPADCSQRYFSPAVVYMQMASIHQAL